MTTLEIEAKMAGIKNNYADVINERNKIIVANKEKIKQHQREISHLQSANLSTQQEINELALRRDKELQPLKVQHAQAKAAEKEINQ